MYSHPELASVGLTEAAALDSTALAPQRFTISQATKRARSSAAPEA
ncbi:hypothetical protein ACFXON_24130 [Bacillus subtilis]